MGKGREGKVAEIWIFLCLCVMDEWMDGEGLSAEWDWTGLDR